MTTADWALVVSFFSIAIAFASFIWNVWSKFIYPKPRLQLHIGIMEVIPNPDNLPPFVYLTATNHGPSDITLYLPIARKKWRWSRRGQLALINPLDNFPSHVPTTSGPFSGGLPKKIAVGEQFSARFVVLKNNWVTEGLVCFGFSDTFGRNHWCSKKNAKYFIKELSEHPKATKAT